MIEIKEYFSGLDLDTNIFELRKQSYIDALNITRDSNQSNSDKFVTNVVGNRLVNFSLPAGTNKVIGSHGVQIRNVVIYFVYNSNSHHLILEYNNQTRVISKIFESLADSDTDILNFNPLGKITSINVYLRDEGDILFFLDSLGRPTTLNITRFKAGEYTPVTREIIDVARNPPLSPPDCLYGNDTAVGTNDFRNKIVRLKYRWIYDDNEKSTYSPISKVPYPSNILDNEFTNVPTNNNVVFVAVKSGGKNVKAIEIAMSFVNRSNVWSDFGTVEVLDKEELSIPDDAQYTYSFYNDSTYPFIDVNESILDFDRVPRYAKAQELANGNVLVYGAIEEGYDKDLDPNVVVTVGTVAAGSGASVGSLIGEATFLTQDDNEEKWIIGFFGIPAVGTVVNVYLYTTPGTVQTLIATYTTVAGDDADDVAFWIKASMDAIGITDDENLNGNEIDFEFNKDDYQFQGIEITSPSSDLDNDSIPTWKWSTSRYLGIIYFDENAVTNGVLYSAKVIFPPYAENGTNQPLIPFINVKIFHAPPVWAHSYQFVITKEPTNYLFWETVSVNDDESDYVYFEITNMALNAEKNPTVAEVLSWTFADGDRMRMIRKMSDDTVYGQNFDGNIEGIVVDPTISSVATTGTFIKVKKVGLFQTEVWTEDNYVIELYRPGQQPSNPENRVYYEFGYQYDIINPTLSNRVHAGSITNQSEDLVTPAESNLYNGDSYFRLRTIYITDTGFGSFYSQDRNFVDFYISAVSSVDGRPTLIDINAKSAYYSTLVRFGQAYQPNTNVNGFNRFYPNNFDEYDYSFGDIMRFRVRDRFIRVFQKLKTGVVPLFNQISKNADGTEISVVTDRLLNPIQYYSGDFGIGTSPESLSSFNYADYFVDNIRGAIIRISNDGLTNLSVLYKVNSFSVSELPLRVNPYFMYGVYDQVGNSYILAMEQAVRPDLSMSPAVTLSFDEQENCFESKLSFQPEMMCSLGTLLIVFKDGQLWTHDNERYNSFFGVDYESSITTVFNPVPLQKKSWMSLTQIAGSIWDCPLIYTNLNSFANQRQETTLNESEFEILESMPSASIKRDMYSRGGKINGDQMKGNVCVVKFRKQNAINKEYLSSVSMYYINSALTKT
jgi:hypothetical protein